MVNKTITFGEICKIEPRLLALYRRAKAIRDDKRHPYFRANAVWYDQLKPVGLVGHNARDERIRTSQAYDVAYDAIYNALPDCRNCACL